MEEPLQPLQPAPVPTDNQPEQLPPAHAGNKKSRRTAALALLIFIVLIVGITLIVRHKN